MRSLALLEVLDEPSHADMVHASVYDMLAFRSNNADVDYS